MYLSKGYFLLIILLLVLVSGCSSLSEEKSSNRNIGPEIFKNIEVWKYGVPSEHYDILETSVTPNPQVAQNGQPIYPSYEAVRNFGVERAKFLKGNAILIVSKPINQHQPIQPPQQIHSATIIRYESVSDLVKQTQLPNNVINLIISKLVDSSNNPLDKFNIYSLSKIDEKELKAKLKTLPIFPENSYSGCHARAHFDYLELSKVTNKTYKVWLMSSALLAPATSGRISFGSSNGEKTSWDYHVALAYTDLKKQEWVIDRLISPEPVPIIDWVEKFEIDGYAALIRGNPDSYLFNKTEVPVSSSGNLSHFMPKNVFNGSFYKYSGQSFNEHWAASDIAVDALSSQFQKGNFSACEWNIFYSDSMTLKSKLVSSNTPAECMKAKSLFNNEFEKWKTLGL